MQDCTFCIKKAEFVVIYDKDHHYHTYACQDCYDDVSEYNKSYAGERTVSKEHAEEQQRINLVQK